MKDRTALLRTLPLFRGMEAGEIDAALRGMRARVRTVPRGAVLVREGGRERTCGIVLSGTLQGQQVGEDGGLSVISTLSRGMMFGEILLFSEIPAPVTLAAVSESEILELNRLDLARLSPRLTENLLRMIAGEYWALHQKIRYCAIVSLRTRIFTYLSDRAPDAGLPFTVPFDRAGMAAYLNADRSALSRELSRMKRDGLIEYRKNSFLLRRKKLPPAPSGRSSR